MAGFEAEWLVARQPYDEAALDQDVISAIRAWGATFRRSGEHNPPLVVVDLGSGTGVAIARAAAWLAPRPIRAYAVDRDASLLRHQAAMRRETITGQSPLTVTPVVGDVLSPLDGVGGPLDGSVDLVLGHALADLVPLDRLAGRVGALLRPGGLAHLALTYNGLTRFGPVEDADLDAQILRAFHRHMDHKLAATPGLGSTAGWRVGPALEAVGLEIVHEAPAVWNVRAADGPSGQVVLDRLIRFVLESVMEIGGVSERDLTRWERGRRAALADGALTVQVAHRDVLARQRRMFR